MISSFSPLIFEYYDQLWFLELNGEIWGFYSRILHIFRFLPLIFIFFVLHYFLVFFCKDMTPRFNSTLKLAHKGRITHVQSKPLVSSLPNQCGALTHSNNPCMSRPPWNVDGEPTLEWSCLWYHTPESNPTIKTRSWGEDCRCPYNNKPPLHSLINVGL